MNNSILLILLSVIFTSSLFASNEIYGLHKQMDNTIYGVNVSKLTSDFEVYNSEVICTLDLEKTMIPQAKIKHDANAKQIHISTTNEIRFVQVLDDKRHLIYQLPVQTQMVNLFTEDLEKGKYEVHMIMKTTNNVIISTVEKL